MSGSQESSLAVYIGAHPDDIDMGMSGSLFKYICRNRNLRNHPILWVVVTDGGGDSDEYKHETNILRRWVAADGKKNLVWRTPNGSLTARRFYSADLARKRCSGYFRSTKWIDVLVSHSSRFGIAYGWMTRVNKFINLTVRKTQLSYMDSSDPKKRLLYPDDALTLAETTYTESIAASLANEIDEVAQSMNCPKNLLYVNSHAPDEIAYNAGENPDHRVVGNAVRQAIELLHTTYGFGQVIARWFTIYDPIQPRTGYLMSKEDISLYKKQKSDLVKECWETAYIFARLRKVDWKVGWQRYPEDPGDSEYTVKERYPREDIS